MTSLKLSAPTIAGIFDGKITKWNDPAIAADNCRCHVAVDADQRLLPQRQSGTTSVFTSFLQQVAGSAWTLGSSKTITFFTGAQGAKGSAGVAAGVTQTEGGITYDEESYAKAQSLPTAWSRVPEATSHLPRRRPTVSTAIGEGFTVIGTGNDLAGKMDYTKMTTGYPISTVSYAIVCTKYKDAAKGSPGQVLPRLRRDQGAGRGRWAGVRTAAELTLPQRRSKHLGDFVTQSTAAGRARLDPGRDAPKGSTCRALPGHHLCRRGARSCHPGRHRGIP